MKRLIIVCEGQTEHEFCKDVLYDSLKNNFDTLDFPLVKHSGGGIVPWRKLKEQIIRHLQESNSFVTTFIDYYGIPDDFCFPQWKSSKQIAGIFDRIKFLEDAMLQDLPENVRYRFIPYIQIHEFEALLFSNIDVFKDNFDEDSIKFAQLQDAVNSFPSPEHINNGRATAPSKRLQRAVPDYNKVIFGNCIAIDIGLETMRKKCQHFNQWLEKLENI